VENELTIRDRWLAAISYLSILVFIPMLATNKSEFLARHCRQGFTIFCLELLSLLVVSIIDATIGRIPVLGFILILLLRLVFFLFFLVISAFGFSKGLFGESWRIPYVDDWAHRVPIH